MAFLPTVQSKRKKSLNEKMNPNQKSAVTFIVNYGFSSKMRYCLMIYYLLFRMQQVRRKWWQVNKMFLNRGRVTCWCWRYTVSVTVHSQQWLDWWRCFQFCRERIYRWDVDMQIQPQTSLSTIKHRVAPCYNTDMWHVILNLILINFNFLPITN